ncbi:Zinc-finger homeodomain protein 4 [Euphorbia peplus]|nr:Zinc-finger homeodomain protein 4 [Euphorbia peplus]
MEVEKEMSRNGDIIIPPEATGLSGLAEEHKTYKKRVVRYKECLKNHAAALGGSATDGCGEFMPSGEQGTLESLKCIACNCHRNFHKKEIDGESSILYLSNHNARTGLPLVHHQRPMNYLLSSRAMPNQQMIVSYGNGSVPSESDEKDGDDDEDKDVGISVRAVEKPKKRFRTRFTQEQKHRMLYFADKVGWKMQNLDDSAVQQFCQEIGIKRRVLKVWMHNNKHHFAKKTITN